MRRTWLIAAFVCVASLWIWLWYRAQPPSGVPTAAVRVAFSKHGGWVHCWLDPQINLNRCHIYNASGDLIHRLGHEGDPDDVFLRYQGTGPVKTEDLQIDEGRTQPDYVWLRNGVILLPRNDFDTQKAFLDRLSKGGS